MLQVQKNSENGHVLPKVIDDSAAQYGRPQFCGLIILERGLDLLSPLFTQLVFSGLLDEVYGIENGRCLKIVLTTVPAKNNAAHSETFDRLNPVDDHETIGQSKLFAPRTGKQDKADIINISDFKDDVMLNIRDRHFSSVGGALNELAKKLCKGYEVCIRWRIFRSNCILKFLFHSKKTK